MQERFATVVKNLENNGFATHCFATGAEATAWLAKQVPAGEQTAFGGSMTLTELGLWEALEQNGVEVIDYRSAAYSAEELYEKQRSVFFTHTYFSSANAITEDGHVLNVDGNGNRVAATIYGPKHIYIVAGRNKLVPDITAAIKRAEDFAGPMNCQRLNKNTPCVKSGKCEHCGPKTSICRAWAVLQYAPYGAEYHVVLIDEELGY